MVDNLDQNIGRLLGKLDEWRCSDNTLVVFMTDNGPNSDRYNAGMKGRADSRIDQRLAHIDVLPTLVELLDLKGAGQVAFDGASFARLLADPAAAWPGRTLFTFPFGAPQVLASRGAVRTSRWLAVKREGKWDLHDILADPLQREEISARHPQIVRELAGQYEAAFAAIAKVQPFAATPIPFGYDARPVVILEAPDATLVNAEAGGIGYNFPAGFAHHWVTGWTSTDAYPEWMVRCHAAGEYEVALQYCLAEGDQGVDLSVELADQALATRVVDVFDPPAHEQPFRIAGEAEKYASKPWRLHAVGTVTLPEGLFPVRVRLMAAPGRQAVELKGVRLRKL